MTETLLIALTTFFATIGPLDVAAMFAALTTNNTARERRAMAVKASLIGGGILLFFALFGKVVLESFGISLAALQASGGILLLLIAIDMVFARDSGSTSTTDQEQKEAEAKQDVSVFPLATPLIAGPGAIGAAILLVSQADGDTAEISLVIGALLAIILMTFLLMLLATQVQRLLGVTGLHVISRVVGVLLAGLAVQFIFDGIQNSGLLN
ncbi:MAG: MarC family protein [Sneathiella sp.]|uniref:MarC family protein n=1 Tax=Sneathiella sp. TaxID=1964365 RepID=UPI0030011A37